MSHSKHELVKKLRVIEQILPPGALREKSLFYGISIAVVGTIITAAIFCCCFFVFFGLTHVSLWFKLRTGTAQEIPKEARPHPPNVFEAICMNL